jgi:hypothetical protein
VGSVQSISPIVELERFFVYLYGDQEGYIYSPTKDPETGDFEQHFFRWPTERNELVQHVLTLSELYEVYYGPGIYRERKATKDSFLGSNFVWTEFDGVLPASDKNGYPHPTLRIKSSVEGHEHWYWRLEAFLTDQDLLENITQRVAYYLQADLSSWDATQVLRPPGTIHHESGNAVTITAWKETNVTKLVDFADLPQVPVKILQDTDINYIPQALKVIAKYPWKDEDFEFFTVKQLPTKEGKPEGQGHRNEALAKLGFICIELGMSNAETLSLLLNADERWGKFRKRRDQKHRLIGIINYCRSKKAAELPPVDPNSKEPEDLLRVYNFEEFISAEIKMEWVVNNLLHKKGLTFLVGPPDIGKSQLTIRTLEKFARGQDFLKWTVPKPTKNLFISMEMGYEELHFFMNDTMHIKSDELLKENLLILPLGSSLPLRSKIAQNKIIEMMEEHRPEGVFIDSFSTAVADELNSDKVILEVMDFVNSVLRARFGAYVWFIHHPRKEQIGNKKPKKLDDLHGSRFIGSLATSVILLWPERGNIEVSCLKLRMAEKFKTFDIRRTPGVDFEIVGMQDPGNISGPIFGNNTLEDTI